MFSRFGGGIHPPGHKSLTHNLTFINLPIPHTCYIPLLQHIGAPAKIAVKAGDFVSEGQLIGAADGVISANVHSSIPGKVADITSMPTVYGPQFSIVIEAEGSFSSSAKPKESSDWSALPADAIISRIRDAGIVGLGGAAFPTAAKLTLPAGRKIDTLIVNGAESGPYLTIDDMLMKSFPDAVIEGTRITCKALGITGAIIGVGGDKKAALSSMKKSLASLNPPEHITVKKIRNRYPQGAERQIIYASLGRKVPSGRLPADIGVIVLNVGTIHAIREAVLYNRPLFARYITISGNAIARPGNYKVRIGTRIADIVEECGGLRGEPARIIMGGPMCGFSVSSLDYPVLKGTTAVLFLSDRETSAGDYRPCIRCGKCVAVCPMGLLPCDLGNTVEKGRFDRALNMNPDDCIMCGSCSYVCPARRPVSHFIKIARQKRESGT